MGHLVRPISRMISALKFVQHRFMPAASLMQPRYYTSASECPNTTWNAEIETAGGFTCKGMINDGAVLVLGSYLDDTDDSGVVCLTKTAALFNHNVHGKLLQMLKASGPLPKLGELRVYPNIDPVFSVVAVVGLGDNNEGYSKPNQREENKENIRIAVGAAVRYFQNLHLKKIYVESFDDAESSAEGAHLAAWENQYLRAPENRVISIPDIALYGDCDWKKWQIGIEKAESQNYARELMEMPANLMTPRTFSYGVIQSLCKTSVNVTLRGENWLRDNNMNAFIANVKGSPQPPFLLEMAYNGCDPAVPPVVLIGKGLTFNSGGLCIKPCDEQRNMRGDMNGAAVVVAVFKALANMGLPVNVRGLIPLGENMPGGTASKPRDIVKSRSGHSILISPTDFDGLLMLADTVCYAQQYKPKYVVSISSMTKELMTGFNSTAAGIYTQNEYLWQLLKTASVHSGDRLWKLPLWNMYEREVVDFTCADLSIMSKNFKRSIVSTIPALLNQVACKPNWAHIDTFGIMYEDGKTSYMKEGMSGRPTRTIVEFLGQMAYPPQDFLEQEESKDEDKSSASQ